MRELGSRGVGLLEVCRRDALEIDLGLGGVHVRVHPSGPRGHPLGEGREPVHVFHDVSPILHIVPSGFTEEEIQMPSINTRMILCTSMCLRKKV